MKKIIISLTSICCIFALSFSAIFAITDDSEGSQTVIIEHSQEQIDKDTELALALAKKSEINPRMNETISEWRYVGKQIFTKKSIGWAGNQKSGGTVFASRGSFHWQDGGYNQSVSFGISLGYGPVSVSLGVSSGSSQMTGKIIESPYVNRACKLYIYKDITVTSYAVYTKPKYSGSWQFSGYKYVPVETREYLEVRPV